MKLTVIGGCGSRGMMLAKSLAQEAKQLHISTICFMDTDEKRLAVFGGMLQKTFALLAPSLHFLCTKDAVEAVKDADFVITTIRVGKEESRIQDERIAIRHGLIGQETTGVGGFAMALRSIPVLLDYCELIRRHAKADVMVFNFTNPAGLVSQALHDAGYRFVYGICDAPSGFLRQLAALYGVSPKAFSAELIGLNHLSYFSSLRLQGRELLPELLDNPDLYRRTDMRYFEPALAKHLQCLLNEYLYYFYYREKAEKNLRLGGTRGERIRDINAGMLKELEALDAKRDFEKMLAVYSRYTYMRESNYMENETSLSRDASCIQSFDLYTEDEGGYAAVALALIRAKVKNREDEMILCIPNGTTVDWLMQDDIIEVSCIISGEGAKAKKGAYRIPESAKNLIRSVKYYERNGAKAILQKDGERAVDALMAHPLVNSYSLAKAVLRDYAAVYEEYMGDWKI